MWPGGLYGAPREAPVTFALADDGTWTATLDAPWTPEGLYLGAFRTLDEAVAFVYGPPVVQFALPLGAA